MFFLFADLPQIDDFYGYLLAFIVNQPAKIHLAGITRSQEVALGVFVVIDSDVLFRIDGAG